MISRLLLAVPPLVSASWFGPSKAKIEEECVRMYAHLTESLNSAVIAVLNSASQGSISKNNLAPVLLLLTSKDAPLPAQALKKLITQAAGQSEFDTVPVDSFLKEYTLMIQAIYNKCSMRCSRVNTDPKGVAPNSVYGQLTTVIDSFDTFTLALEIHLSSLDAGLRLIQTLTDKVALLVTTSTDPSAAQIQISVTRQNLNDANKAVNLAKDIIQELPKLEVYKAKVQDLVVGIPSCPEIPAETEQPECDQYLNDLEEASVKLIDSGNALRNLKQTVVMEGVMGYKAIGAYAAEALKLVGAVHKEVAKKQPLPVVTAVAVTGRTQKDEAAAKAKDAAENKAISDYWSQSLQRVKPLLTQQQVAEGAGDDATVSAKVQAAQKATFYALHAVKAVCPISCLQPNTREFLKRVLHDENVDFTMLKYTAYLATGTVAPLTTTFLVDNPSEELLLKSHNEATAAFKLSRSSLNNADSIVCPRAFSQSVSGSLASIMSWWRNSRYSRWLRPSPARPGQKRWWEFWK